jgi:cytosine/adenosine deaminase-related metal-dependent hydrolase
MATLNGAEALNVSDIYGSIDIGKRPGLNLITNFDFANMRLQSTSGIKTFGLALI